MTSGVQIYPTSGEGLPLVGATGALSALDDLLRLPVMGPDPVDTVVRAGAVTVSDFKVYMLAEAQQILDDTQAIYDAFDSTFLGVFVDDAAAETAAGGTPDEGAQYFNSTASESRIYVGSSWYPMSYNSTNVAITGGTIEGVEITDLTGPVAIADGGTGGATKLAAVTALGLGTVPIHCTADETTPNAIELTTGFGISTVPVGFEVTWLATAANTGAMTIKLDTATAAAAVTPTGAALKSGFIRVFDASTNPVKMRAWWNGTAWVVHRGTQIVTSGDDVAIRYENGQQEVAIKKATLSYESITTCSGTVTFPSAFISDDYAATITIRTDADTGSVDARIAAFDDDLTNGGLTLGPIVSANKSVGSMVAGVVSTAGDFETGDALYVSVIATGRWY